MVREPDWVMLFNSICRFYPAYSYKKIGDELTLKMMKALLQGIAEQPFTPVVLCEPPKR